MAAEAAAYPWVVAAAVAAAAAAMIAKISRTPRANGLPRLPPAGDPPPPLVTSPGLAIPMGVPPSSPVPKPPGPGQPLPALIDILPGAPFESRALAAARSGGMLVPVAVEVAPKGWAGRSRGARPVPAPRPGMRKSPLPSPPMVGHTMIICIASRRPAPALALCETFYGSSAPTPACDPAPPATAPASALALLSTLSSFRSAFAPASGRKRPRKADRRCTRRVFP